MATDSTNRSLSRQINHFFKLIFLEQNLRRWGGEAFNKHKQNTRQREETFKQKRKMPAAAGGEAVNQQKTPAAAGGGLRVFVCLNVLHFRI